MPNASLVDSVNINIVGMVTYDFGGIKNDRLFSTGPKADCFWKMDLGSSMHVKVVLIMGDYTTKANTADWKLTVGNDSNPLLNL